MKKKKEQPDQVSDEPRDPYKNVKFLLFLFLVLGLPGLFLIGHGIYMYYRAIASASWPSVTGIITDVRVDRVESTDVDGDTDVSFCIRYNYTYTVKKVSYTNSEYCVSTGIVCYSAEKDALAHQMEKGMDIKIYYDPEKPADSCVQRSENITHLGAATITFGVIIFIVFIVLMCCILKENSIRT